MRKNILLGFVAILLFSFLIKNIDLPRIFKKTQIEKVLSAQSIIASTPFSTATSTPIPTLVLTLTSIPTLIPSPTATPIQISGSSELSTAINNYRRAKGLNSLSNSSILCNIAQNRANELLMLGHLDDHAGWSKYWTGQHEFESMGEIIAYASYQADATYVVNSIWGQSSPHTENMSDPKWANGCGSTSNGSVGYFYTFEFGKN